MGAQQREEAGCGSARDYLIGLAVSVDGHIVPEVARRFFEEVAAHAPGLVVVRRNLVQRLLGAGLLDSHHARRSLIRSVSYTHLRAHETVLDLVCRLLL